MIHTSFLLGRLYLEFNSSFHDSSLGLSTGVFSPDGSLWVASDETQSIERLSAIDSFTFGNQKTYSIGDYVELFNPDGEIDIEGMDYADGYLWFTGSHSLKRGNAKGKKPEKDFNRLEKVRRETNRFLLGRIPIEGGNPVRSSQSEEPSRQAACLRKTENGNQLTEILADDTHIGPFIKAEIPGKENGFDIEGLAIFDGSIYLGLRGPVLGGWAIVLKVTVNKARNGIFELQRIGQEETYYQKYLVNLHGLGIREICFQGHDLLVMAGPTMAIDGATRVFKIKNFHKKKPNSAIERSDVEYLFDLPTIPEFDYAEGMALNPSEQIGESIIVFYDQPDPRRRVEKHTILADVFRLNP